MLCSERLFLDVFFKSENCITIILSLNYSKNKNYTALNNFRIFWLQYQKSRQNPSVLQRISSADITKAIVNEEQNSARQWSGEGGGKKKKKKNQEVMQLKICFWK